jgi:hypothetical protein
MIDCGQFQGRRRDICRGCDERGRPVLTPEKRRAYLRRWVPGLPEGDFPLPDCRLPKHGRTPSTAGRPRPLRRGLGDVVARGIRTATFGLLKPCGGCKQRQATLNHLFPADLPAVEPVVLDAPRRHLLFYVWPVKANGAWQWNCDRLLQHASLFNGRRIVAIAESAEAQPATEVVEYLSGFTDEFVTVRNSRQLREVAAWLPMLERLEPFAGEQDVTFTCHAKGVRHRIRPDNKGSTVFRWAEAMYETCLADWPAVRAALETHGTAGSFRRFQKLGGWGPWHYSGTFFWFRNRDVFARNWRYVPRRFYGTEAWPGLMFRPEESACLACDQVKDLYKLEYWMREIEPELQAWRAARNLSVIG